MVVAGWAGLCGHESWSIKQKLFEIGCQPNSVDNCKQSGRIERGENPVPCPAMIIHALTGRCPERMYGARPAPVIWRDNHQKRMLAHRKERLRALWMPLKQVNLIRQAARRCVKQANSGPAGRSEIKLSEIVMPPALPAIDDHVRRVSKAQHITKRRKSIRSQRLGNDLRAGHAG